MSYDRKRGAASARIHAALFSSALVLSTLLATNVSATVFNVTDQASYDAAVTAANGSGGPHTINITVAGTYNQNVAATFAGDININAAGAIVQGISANEYNSGLRVTVATGATFNTGAFVQTIGSLAGSGTVNTDSAAGILIAGGDNSSTAFSGTIIKTGGQFGTVAKVGTGTLTINGAQMSEGEFYGVQGTLANTAGSTSMKYIAVGTGTGNSASMTMSGGTLNITGIFPGAPPCASNCPALQVGDFGGTGVLTQTAGTVIIGAAGVAGSMNIGNQGGTGTYNMSGGILQLGVFGDVNSAGLYSIGRSTTATRNSVGNFNISGTALVDVQAGELINGDRDGTGAGATTSSTITQTGGTVRVRAGANLWLSAFDNGNAVDSVYNLNGGTLEIGDGRLQANYGAGGGVYQFNLGNATIKVIDSALVTSVAGILTGGSATTGIKLDTNGLGATWNGILSGTGWIVKTGLGTLSLGGVNTYTGGTAFNGGAVFVDVTSDLGATTAAMSFNGGTLQLGANGVLALRTGGTNMAGAGTIDTNGFSSVYDGSITGSGALTKVGLGTLDLGGSNNAHSGALNINAGVLNASFGSAIGDTSAVTVAGGALFQVGTPETIGSLAGSGTTTLFSGSTLTTGGNNLSTTWTGTLNESGAGAKLTKTGTGTFTVNANLTYTGLTTVSAGTMLLNGTMADSLLIAAGATFGGNATVTGTVTNNGIVAPGNSPGTNSYGAYIAGSGAVFNMEVEFNNAGAPINGTTHDFVSVTGSATGATTLLNIIPFAPSNAPAATTGNGVELVRVAGATTGGQFALAAPVFQGGYQYVLVYLPNYSGVLDGWFLQSQTREELWGHAAMLSAGQAMTNTCFRGGDELSSDIEGRRGRAWAKATGGNRHNGADTGVETDQDFVCGSGGIDLATGDAVRIGLGGGFGDSNVDVRTPAGLARLEGNESMIEGYASYAKDHMFANLSAGYATTDWKFKGPAASSSATVDGPIASAQAGMRWPMGDVRLGLLAELDYDGTTCGNNCLLSGANEDTSQWRAKGTARLDGVFSDGRLLPYAALSISDNLDSGNTVSLGTAVVTSDPSSLLGAEVGLTALVGERTALFGNAGIVEGLQNDVSGFQGQGGLKLYW